MKKRMRMNTNTIINIAMKIMRNTSTRMRINMVMGIIKKEFTKNNIRITIKKKEI
jgi:hypothetical protein